MAPQEPHGETLGEKHRDYNKIFRQQLVNHSSIPEINLDDTDVNNLLKIDLASHKKDVNYILEVLKCEDMLYVSRALAKCKWLVIDPEFADIINPEYLQAELFPNMTTKAVVKFKKHIRHNIKDESRAEKFYLNEKNITDAAKWLPYCSVPFIESKVVEHITTSYGNTMKLRLFKRLCEKSESIFETIIERTQFYETNRFLHVVSFLLNTNADKYLEILEKCKYRYGRPTFNRKATDLIMKYSRQRVLDKIETYASIIHIPTFVKYLKPDEIKAFLEAQAKKDLDNDGFSEVKDLFYYDRLKHFIRRLPKDEQFDFIKQICTVYDLPSGVEPRPLFRVCSTLDHRKYIWYEFAPFEYAFAKITDFIAHEANEYEKRNMLNVLITCANHNLKNLQVLIKYFITKYKNEDSSFKMNFAAQILQNTRVPKYDENTWNLINQLLCYKDICSNHTEIVNSVIIYNALNGKKVPEAIENLFTFDTLKSYRSAMNQEQQEKIFDYLYEHIAAKVNNPISTEKELRESIKVLGDFLKLINDWDKSLLDYPIVLNKIRELIKLKKENSWKVSLSSLYNINKSWRKIMFEESVALHPCEEVCLNALKHDPQLLDRYKGEVDTLRTTDTVSLQRLLAKLRIYWPHSLAQQWIDAYLNTIKETTGQKAAVRGLCTVLHRKPLQDIIEKYKPDKAKIDWKQTDELVLNIQRFLAKNMHLGRPQPKPDAILAYAKGDYLQFALPSLLAIFYNLKAPMNELYIPKLLDAPVSVQKHGIRLAFKQLDREKLKDIFLSCWKTSKNVSIRAIIFKYTFTLLTSEQDDTNASSLYDLVELFIDNLTLTEDKDIYKLLSEVGKVPMIVRAKFLVKSYDFLQKLIPNMDENNTLNYKFYMITLAEHSREVMETISPNFVITIIQEFIEYDFFKCEDKFGSISVRGIIQVISAYLLCVKDENEQLHKYERLFLPLMRRAFAKWDEKRNGNFYIRQNFQQMLTRLTFDLKEYVIEKKLLVPLKMYSLIQTELEKHLSVPENYIMLTVWKLTVELTKLTEQYSVDKEWDEKFGLEFGNVCQQYLKKDVATYFPCIYVLFSKAVKQIHEIMPNKAVLQFYEGMLSDSNFIHGYLSSIEMGVDSRYDDEYKQIWQKVFAHPSAEVKMHYYCKIDEKTP